MDLVKLDPSTYLPTYMVEGYNSLIWTERYVENGEFEVKTARVSETQTLLPELSMVSLLDTREVMVVETHSIGKDSDGYPELTVTGRSFDTFLENRNLLPTVYGEGWPTYQQYTAEQLISVLMWMGLVNTTGQDPTRAARTIDASTGISSIFVTNSGSQSGTTQIWTLEAGDLYSIIRDILILKNLGIRAVRPPSITKPVVSVDTSSTATRGTVTFTTTSNISGLCLDLYVGVDRTYTARPTEAVVFHYESGHIDDPSYLFSKKDLKNLVDVYSSIGHTPVSIAAPGTGLSRRALIMDGGTQGTAQSLADFTASITQKAQIELKKHNRAVLFDGAISTLAPYKYKTHYDLGDKVNLVAEYGYTAEMQVNEYVRTEDAEGDRGYPGLVLAT